jgi:hypothetical protein
MNHFPATFKNINNEWRFGNPTSTYELCGHIQRKLGKADAWKNNLYDTLKTDSDSKVFRYGTYAGLNDWSPTFTHGQLEEFISLVCTFVV